MKEFDKVLDQNERVVWEGSPSFLPFFLSMCPHSIGGLVMIGIFTSFFFTPNSPTFLTLLPPILLGAFFTLISPVWALLVFKHTHYVITSKRVIFQTGLIGRDFNQVDFDQITDVRVAVGVFDKICGGNTGSIHVSGDPLFTVMRNISAPYDVFKILKQVSHDVKTDIEYPNKLRPAENPGYQTTYSEPKI